APRTRPRTTKRSRPSRTSSSRDQPTEGPVRRGVSTTQRSWKGGGFRQSSSAPTRSSPSVARRRPRSVCRISPWSRCRLRSGASAEDVRKRAEGIVDEVVKALTREPPPMTATAAAETIAGPDDLDAFQEFVMTQGWGDGLPVLPATRSRVARILGRGRADEVVSTLAPRPGVATLETIAATAALAGAGPEHLPVIVAAVRALADPRFNLFAIQTTTHPCTPLVIVNGPIARRLGIGGGPNALGNGYRANAVIGRTVRLVLQNVGGAKPGSTRRAPPGHPGKVSYHGAENEEASPWETLAVERGFGPDESTVTVCGSEGPHNVNDHGSTSPEALLHAVVGTAATTGSNNIYLGGEPLVILGPEHAQTIAA